MHHRLAKYLLPRPHSWYHAVAGQLGAIRLLAEAQACSGSLQWFLACRTPWQTPRMLSLVDGVVWCH
jgi:hypothetical protein